MIERTKEWIAMLLAGGQGSRLSVLTEKTAKPAVPFGAKYRIIDFSLSNCVNSGIDTVGILTQYQPLELNQYIGNGQPWGLNRNSGGVHILPPFTKAKKNEWYKGTANAIYQNIPFIERYHPEVILVLSGDHIYKMDYQKMLREHKKNKSECTIAVRSVSIEEASRMGILSCDGNGAITEFEEKPANPKSCLASMGVYLFDWPVLRDYLIADEKDPQSQNDFGKNIIPAMLADKRRLFAYAFEGYWKDVGTLESLWEANMDMLAPTDPMRLGDTSFRIYGRNYARPSSVFYPGARIARSYVAEGCVIRGRVENSIIFTGCTVEEGASLYGAVLMPNSYVGKDCRIDCAILGEGCTIGRGCTIGQMPREGDGAHRIAVIGQERSVKEGSEILPKQVV